MKSELEFTRVEELRRQMTNAKLDGYIVLNPKNVYYFTGFKDISNATLGLIIPIEDELHLWTYSLSYTIAKEEAKNCVVNKVKSGEKLHQKVAEKIKDVGFTALGFDKMSVNEYRMFSDVIPSVDLNPKLDLVLSLRGVKSREEIKMIKEAAKLADIGVERGMEAVKSGIHEYEVAAEIEYAMRRNGSEGVAFETLVASGPRSAFPHGVSTSRIIKNGEFVVMDLGATYQGYRSDITRTLIVGQPSDKQKKIFEIVLKAQEIAFQKIRSGVSGRDVDAAGREFIEKNGYGDNFIHGLGHGVGLDVHDPPRLSPSSNDVLIAGNVVTDEPGIYIEGYGGVRIEDMVLVEDEGAIKLTRARKPLLA